MPNHESLEHFYKHKLNRVPENLDKEFSHFNVFKLEDFLTTCVRVTPYNRKDFFKISLIIGKNRVHYADRTIEIEKHGLFFANPQIPYNWEYLSDDQHGFFCIFSESFFNQFGAIKEYPLFKPGGNPVYFFSDEELIHLKLIFEKMSKELESDFQYKYDVIRTLVLELIHLALKMEPAKIEPVNQNAAGRISVLFSDLLEKQFPIESLNQRMNLRSATDYADQLAIHVNYLNRAIKESTGKTTSQIIGQRVTQEAKALLKHTSWNIAEIGYSLGFEDPPNFNTFFKKHAGLTPKSFRTSLV